MDTRQLEKLVIDQISHISSGQRDTIRKLVSMKEQDVSSAILSVTLTAIIYTIAPLIKTEEELKKLIKAEALKLINQGF